MIRRLLAIALALTGSSQAFGQADDPLRMPRSAFEQQMATLDLPPPQRAAAKELFAEYAKECDDGLAAFHHLEKWCWSNTDSNWFGGESEETLWKRVWIEDRVLMEHWNREARALEERYFDDLHHLALGLDSTVESLRRRRVRERMLRPDQFGGPAGAETDLVALCTAFDSNLPSDPAIGGPAPGQPAPRAPARPGARNRPAHAPRVHRRRTAMPAARGAPAVDGLVNSPVKLAGEGPHFD